MKIKFIEEVFRLMEVYKIEKLKTFFFCIERNSKDINFHNIQEKDKIAKQADRLKR